MPVQISEKAAQRQVGHEPDSSIKDHGEQFVHRSDSQREKVQDDGASSPSQDKTPDKANVQYTTGWRLIIIIFTIDLSTLIASLDLGIVATAIPKITQDFHGLDNIGWYSGVCFLLVGCTSAMWGKMFKYLNAKWTYMAALAIYIVGSIVAAVAPNSNALIVGRAIQGWGCSGCLGGSVIIINHCAEPKRRPLLIGLWMGISMCATTLGPVIGGVFTSEVTWRWCFWINLPIGGVALVLQFFALHIPKHIKPAPSTWKTVLLHLDFPGFTFLLASVVCLTLALQWGGLTKPWSDGSVVATLVMWIVLWIGFFMIEWLEGKYAMMPLNLLKPRMTWVQCLYILFCSAYLFQALFYLPIYFQAIKGTSAIMSGVYNLPLVAFFALGATLGGGFVGKTLLLHPPQLLSGLLATVGAALLHNLDINSSKAWYIGAQIPLGLGCGLGTHIPVTAVQSFAKPEDMSTVTGIVFTFQTIAGAYFVVAAESIFENRLVEILAQIAPDINPEMILGAGASQLQTHFSKEQLPSILDAYMVGIKDVFAFFMANAAVTVVLVFLIPLKKLPNHEDKKTEDHEAAA